MEWKCGNCHYYVTSSITKTITKSGKVNVTVVLSFCSCKKTFVAEDDNICEWFTTQGTLRCSQDNSEVSFVDCFKCKKCDIYEFLRDNVKVFKGKNREEVLERVMENIQDIRVVIETAINELNKTGLARTIAISKPPLKMKEDELRKLVNSFLDAVESIPYDKEKDIPDYVVNVYNRIVDNELVIIADDFEGMQTTVSSNLLLLRRTKLPPISFPNNIKDNNDESIGISKKENK